MRTHIRKLKDNKYIIVYNKMTEHLTLICSIFMLLSMISIMFGIVENTFYSYRIDYIVFCISAILILGIYYNDLHNLRESAKKYK